MNSLSVSSFIDTSNGRVRYCPITPGCNFPFEYDGSYSEFDCPKCQKSYCIACKIPYHKGMSCAAYIEEQARIERERREAAER
jgi:hypothetical protein